MGQYCYLINKDHQIRVEAYKYSGGGEESLRIEEEKKLVEFLEYCRENKLKIEVVSENYFDDIEICFTDF